MMKDLLIKSMAIFSILFMPLVFAQAPGSLDVNFNQTGKKIIHFDMGSNKDESGKDVYVYPDNSMLIASDVQFNDSEDVDMGLSKIDKFGNFDASFGNGGQMTIAFDLGGDLIDRVNDIVVYDDGRVLLVGSVQSVNGDYDFALVRLNSDGSLDTTFNGDGKLTIGFNEGGDNDDRANAAVLVGSGIINAPDIYIVGDVDQAIERSIALVKIDEVGQSLLITHSRFNPGVNANVRVGVFDIVKASSPANSFWILGYAKDATNSDSPYLIKVDNTGNVVSSASNFLYHFIATDIRTNTGYQDVAKKQGSDEFVFIGYDYHNGSAVADCALLVVDASISLMDPTWSGDNIDIHHSSQAPNVFGSCYDGEFNSSDNLIVSGDIIPDANSASDMALLKLTAINVADFGNGPTVISELDANFGNQGKMNIVFDVGGAASLNSDSAYYLALSPDGGIMALGEASFDGNKTRTAVARVLGGGSDILFKNGFE